MTREAAVQTTARRRLTAEGAKGIKASPANGAGTPDWIGSYRGRALVLEFKAPGASTDKGRARLQLHEQNEWAKAGAIVATIDGPEVLERVLAFADAVAPGS